MKQKNKWKIDKFMKLENPTTPTKTWSTEIESDCKLKNTTNMCFILDPYLDYNPDLDITDLDGKLKHNNECFIQKSVNWFLKTKLFIRSLRHNGKFVTQGQSSRMVHCKKGNQRGTQNDPKFKGQCQNGGAIAPMEVRPQWQPDALEQWSTKMVFGTQ